MGAANAYVESRCPRSRTSADTSRDSTGIRGTDRVAPPREPLHGGRPLPHHWRRQRTKALVRSFKDAGGDDSQQATEIAKARGAKSRPRRMCPALRARLACSSDTQPARCRASGERSHVGCCEGTDEPEAALTSFAACRVLPRGTKVRCLLVNARRTLLPSSPDHPSRRGARTGPCH